MRWLVLIVLLLGALPRPSASQETRGRCSVASIDSVFARSGPVFRDCDVDRPARLRRAAPPAWTFPEDRHCAIAELVFVVDTTGVPDTLTATIVDTDTPDYATRVLLSLVNWRYRPALRGGVAVRQLVRERVAQPRADGRVPFVIGGQPPPAPMPTPPLCR